VIVLKKYIILGTIIIAISVIGYFAYVALAGDGEEWIDPDPDDPVDPNDPPIIPPDPGDSIGKIKHGLTVLYTDGTQRTIEPYFSLSLFNDEKEIDTIQYILQAKSNNKPIDVSVANYSIHFDIYDEDAVDVSDYDAEPPNGAIKTVGTEWTMVTNIEINPVLLMSDLSAGHYHLVLLPQGHIEYLSSTGWKDTNLPKTIEFDIDVTTSGQLILVFSGGIGVD
jgi:hypothetical protein